VSSATPSTFVNAIETLIDDAAERERLGKAGRELYDSRFDVRHAAAALHAAVS
jgi:glycosyltransferase involved in cell wall biosynthesis